MEIPDCYDPIYQAEAREAARHTVRCCDCGKELTGDDPVFDWGGGQICETCCKTAIEENFSISEIADALKIPARYAADAEATYGY